MNIARPSFLVSLVGCLLAACGSAETAVPSADPAPSSEAAPVAPAVDGPLAIDPRDQYALLAELEAAEAADEDAISPAMAAVRQSWQGHRYRWDMMRVDAFCSGPATCFVGPYDLGRFDHPIHASYLPTITMTEAEYARMQTECAPHAPECVVTIEATLERLVFSPELPTSMALTEVHLVSARHQSETEHFLSRPPIRAEGTPVPLERLGVTIPPGTPPAEGARGE